MKIILGQRDLQCSSHWEREERWEREDEERAKGRVILSSSHCNYVCSGDEGDCCPLNGKDCSAG